MEPRQRTHLVNELMEEAGLMMNVLKKAMEGTREQAHFYEENPHIPDEKSPPPPTYTLEEEHTAWETVCTALHEIQARLDQIEQAERERIERFTPRV